MVAASIRCKALLNMASSVMVGRCSLLIILTACSFHCLAYGNMMRLFGPGPPDFVNISDMKTCVQDLVDNVTNRLRCTEHGLLQSDCVKCLKTDSILHLLNIDPGSKSISRQNVEDLAILFAHHVMYFESLCTSQPVGCGDFHICQEELFEYMTTRTAQVESLVKVLRIFKMTLKEGEKKECFTAEDILKDVPRDGNNPEQRLRRIFTLLMGKIFQGYCIDAGESVTDFLDDIFHHYGDTCSTYMNLDGLKRMMEDLQNVGHRHDDDHDHHHSHQHDGTHDASHHHECEHIGGYTPHFHNHNHDHSAHMHDTPYDHKHYHGDHDHDRSLNYDRDQNDHDIAKKNKNHYDTENKPTQPNEATSSKILSQHEDSTIPSTDGNSSATLQAPKVSPTIYAEAVDLKSIENSEDVISVTIDPRILPNGTLAGTPNSEEEQMKSTRRTQRSAYRSLTSKELRNTEDFHNPASSLRSDFSHQEEKSGVNSPNEASLDEVKKVYLLQNDGNNRNIDLPLSGTPHHFASLATKCLSAEDLILKFGHQENTSLTKHDFLELCPALIQQIVSGVCSESILPPSALPSRSEVYGYGSLSVAIISLTSLAGVFLLPVMTKHAYNYIISGFYGLAFSTLAGDALLHLMPQFLGLHSHGGGDDHGHSHSGAILEPYAQLQLGVFFTVYFLFLFEAALCAFSKSDHHAKHQDNKGHGHSHVHLPDEIPTLISVKSKSETQLPVSREQSSSSLDTEVVEVEVMKKPPNLMVSKPLCLGLTSMAIVVTLGDSIHNFGDGLAIGAAFSTGIRGGLSTAIAVFCHELPHEFGDFVVLLSTGLSFSKALWINFLSGLTCFAGLYIGIIIGDDEVARKWIMGVTAGIFLYVALGEMLPELREHQHGSPIKMLLIKNLGILAGITIMLVISIYEHDIV